MKRPRHHDRKARHDQVIIDALGLLLRVVHRMSIDTSKVLAAVALERTENASLRALLAAHVTVEGKLSEQLSAALAKAPPVAPTGDDVAALKAHIADLESTNKAQADAMAAVQADLDQAASDLATDAQATKDAIAANQLPADQQQPTPPPDPALPSVAQTNQPTPSTDPAAAQQEQPPAVPFRVSNDDNPAKEGPAPSDAPPAPAPADGASINPA